MSSSCESEMENDSNKTYLNTLFVHLLKDHSILLDKSQLPDIKRKKQIALKKFQKAREVNSGKVSEEKFKKRVENEKIFFIARYLTSFDQIFFIYFNLLSW